MIGVSAGQSSHPSASATALRSVGGPAGLVGPLASHLALPVLAGLLVSLPVFAQAPWVRHAPMAAALFTAPLLGLALTLEDDPRGLRSQVGAVLVGFCGSWLGGSLFWGWCRLHPLWHLPVEGFALPLALAGLGGRWRLAATFYLASLAGTAATDGVMALAGLMDLWPRVLTASPVQAPLLLQEAGRAVLQPVPLAATALGGLLLAALARNLWGRGTAGRVAATVLATTMVVDGLFLVAALLAPGLSGLI